LSIEKKDTKLDNVERSAKLHTLSLRENDQLITIVENLNGAGDKIKAANERYIEYAKDLAYRIDLKDETLPIKEYKEISGYTVKKLRERGLDENKVHYVYDALKDYPEFKESKYNNNRGSVNRPLENLNPNSLSKQQIQTFVESLDKDQVQTFDEELQSIAIRRKIALSREPESIHDIAKQYEQKISINDINITSEIDDKSIQVNFNKLIKSLSLFRDNFVKINKKMEKYPLTDDNIRRELNYYILDVETRIDAINNVLQSLADDKGTLSPARWWLMKGFLQDITIGGLASMLKQTTLSGKPKKPTTKGIKKADTKKFENYQKAVDFTEFALSIRTLIYHLNNWYDCSSLYPNVRITHKVQLHDKRSEARIPDDIKYITSYEKQDKPILRPKEGKE